MIFRGSCPGNVSVRELIDDNLLNNMSSDYVPSSLLQAAIRLGNIWENMAQKMATVTEKSTQTVHLTDRGILEIGKSAHLIRCRLHTDWARILQGHVCGKHVT